MKIKAKMMALALVAGASVFHIGCSLGSIGWVGQFIGDALGDALWLGGID